MEKSHAILAGKSSAYLLSDLQTNPLMLNQLFERTVDSAPDKKAVIYGAKEYSYKDLDQYANQIAHHLSSKGIKAQDRVGILLKRSIETYAAIIGVLKLGATYIPLDTSYPIDRINYIVEDADITLLVSTESVVAQKNGISCPQIVLLDREKSAIEAMKDSLPDVALPDHPENEVCYIIYTSGSTGNPKGVEIEHKSIVNFLNVVKDVYDFHPSDRVYQGMSIAFDFSFEEIWTTFNAGATLIVAPVGECSLIGGDLASFLTDNQVTVLVTVPTLLSSIEGDIPGLRLINIGGEPVPPELVELWTKPGRRVLNTYGPTETTVTATWAEMEKGKPVTIGRPLPSYMVFIADEKGQQLPNGEKGEICIGGIGVARGYVKRPEQTAKCFIPDPDAEEGSNARYYRTGDLGRYTEEGEIEFHGRVDLQVKFRGNRIELSEIESRIMTSEDVQAVAVAVKVMPNGIEELVAYVVPKLGHDIDKTRLHAILQKHLPPVMVPAYIETIAEFPVLTSGKIDRKALPKPGLTRLGSNKPFVEPEGEMENKVAEIWQNVLRLDKISATDNFFLDLGGYSLLAAKTISELRKKPEMAFLNLVDLYQNPTIKQLAAKVASRKSKHSNPVKAQSSAKSDAIPTEKSKGNPIIVTAAQSAWLLMELLVGSALAYLGLFWVLPRLSPWISSNFPWLTNLWNSEGIGFIVLVLTLAPILLTVASLVYLPVSIAIAVSAKKILIGSFTPTRVPAWSSLHFRMWIMRKFMQFIPWGMIEGTEFQCMALRALGARIGKRVHIHHGVNLLQGGWDLLTIGDDVTLSQDASVVLVELEKGQVVLGPVTLEDGATLDVRAGVGPNTRVGRNARLTALSWLSEGSVIPDGEMWKGVPAQPVGKAPEPPILTETGKQLSPIVHGIAMILGQTLYNGLFALPYTLVLVLFLTRFDSYDSFLSTLGDPAANLMLFAAIGVYMCLAQVSMVALEAVASRALGAVKPGVISRWSLAYIRIWLKTALVSSVDMWLSGSRNYPVWLRAAGMEVGRRSEIGSIMDVVPELVHVNNVSFFADGIYLGGPRIQKGTVTLENTIIENNVFLGNHVVVPAGQRLPEDLLIGVSTVADDGVMKAGSSWFGNPPFDLINREVIVADRSLTSEPSLIRIFNRSLWDWLRFTLPFVPTIIAMFWFSGVIYASEILPVWALVLFGIPAVSLACGASLPLMVIFLKWGLLGRVKDGQHALYSCWTSRWDFLSVASEFIATRPMVSFEGTLLLNVYLRLMGVKIGKRVLLADGYSHFVDHDMIEIGDYATVGAMYQAHTFEDRMLKIGHIRLGNHSTLGNNTVPLYLSNVGEHTFVAPASVIMKGETLPSRTSWDGNPAQLIDESESPISSIIEESSKVSSLPLAKGKTLHSWMNHEGVQAQMQQEDESHNNESRTPAVVEA